MNRNELRHSSLISDREITKKEAFRPCTIIEIKKYFPPSRQSSRNGERWQTKQRKQIAFHIAGHAAAMYSIYPDRRFPSIFFQLATDAQYPQKADSYRFIHDVFQYSIECWRQLPPLPFPTPESAPGGPVSTAIDAQWQTAATIALERDIITLLAGPLAEARYVHDCDNEPMTRHLVDLCALHHYGGSPDLILVQEALQRFPLTTVERTKKLQRLFRQTFDFTMTTAHWNLIAQLADFIDQSRKNVLSYQEIVAGAVNRTR